MSAVQVLRRTLALWRGKLGTVLAYWFPVAAVTVLVRVAMERLHGPELARYEAEVTRFLAGGSWDPDVLVSTGSVFLPYAVLIGVLYALFFAGIFALVESYVWGEEVRAGRGFRSILANLPAILGVVLVVWLAFTVGLLLLVLPALVAMHYLLVSIPAAAGGEGVGGSLRESVRVMSKSGGVGFVLVLGGLWLVAEMVSATAAALVVSALGLGVEALLVTVASGLVEWVVDPLLPIFVSMYYLEARSAAQHRSAGAGSASVPPPTRREEGSGFRMARCSECGTYGPSEGTSFTCPSCGHRMPLDDESSPG